MGQVNVLAYFESVCGDTAAANVVVNSTLTLLLVRMLRNARAPGLRLRLASLLGVLIRHATYITDDLASSGAPSLITNTIY
jgi:serine/threonine-protein kinase ULK4